MYDPEERRVTLPQLALEARPTRELPRARLGAPLTAEELGAIRRDRSFTAVLLALVALVVIAVSVLLPTAPHGSGKPEGSKATRTARAE